MRSTHRRGYTGAGGGNLTPTSEIMGVTERELSVIIAVIAHERCFGRGPLRMDLQEFLGSFCSIRLVRRGFLEQSGQPQRLTSTKRAHRLTGWSTDVRIDPILQRVG